MEAINKMVIETLVELQTIEVETKGLRSRVDRVPQKLQSFDARLRDIETVIASEKSRFEELKKTYRSHESDVELNLSKIRKSRDKLRLVKNNKEYQSILKEIDDIKAASSGIEDVMIECLDQIETAEQFLRLKQSEFEALKGEIDGEKMTLLQETEADKKRLSQLEAEWKRISGRVDPELMKTYLVVREKRGTAIAAVNKFVCQGCNLNIPPQMYNELQRCDSLRFCPHCQRIVYWREAEG